MLADVAHTRPTPVRVSTADPEMAQRLGLRRPQYQGPTGIVGILQDAFAKVRIPVGSIMAQVPHYIPGTPSPKATLALVERVCGLLTATVPTDELQQASVRYEREVDEAVAHDSDISRYVRELHRRSEQEGQTEAMEELPSADALAAQLEQFLREQGDTP
jgi:predicted ATP-grasp superfamily ATP-dependent carboligase